MIEIIPAIDIINGCCVRLTKGDFDRKTVYSNKPEDIAKGFEDAGIKRLHLVDLDGAKTGKLVNLDVLKKIVSTTSMEIDFGGGIKTTDDVKEVLDAGAKWATIGSVAVKQPELFAEWMHQFAAEKIMLGADVKNELLVINGWLKQTDINLFDFIEEKMKIGVKRLFCTDVAMDGLLEGPSVSLYKKIKNRFPDLYLIASGGVSGIADVEELEQAGCQAVIIGKAIYEERITFTELQKYLN